MALQSHTALAEIRDTLLETYACNDGMNQVILAELDPRGLKFRVPQRLKPVSWSFYGTAKAVP